MSESSFRALLIGVPSYRDESIKDLPFIQNDLSELAEALNRNGYVVDVHDVDQTGRDEIESAVEIFFQEALPEQTLLLFGAVLLRPFPAGTQGRACRRHR
ncbi:caspase family protein [Streptomyces sp. ISL-100]|uniref:caspase family protein n=1 Tax=Streptomyces sp. ISL-100 TaxID=2819173 RepID=UPI001BEA3F5B|nr:caspase family protein [Streptomyces sp. ISL-100]MBT2398620.1 caspase family protein [Streptomyces sp. ISL-100]